jgi:hypothetical protein
MRMRERSKFGLSSAAPARCCWPGMRGVINTGDEPLVYLAITAPPEDFTARYEQEEKP